MDSALILSFVEWSGAFQRPQHLALGLARRGFEVHYVCPGYMHRRGINRAEVGIELPGNLHVHRIAALPGAGRLGVIRRINQRLMARGLRQLEAGRLKLIVFNDPRLAPLTSAVETEKRVFDCMDDLSATSSDPEWVHRMEEKALGCVDHVWTGTYSLAERLAGKHRSITFVPCGVEAGHFAQPGEGDQAEVLAELPSGEGRLAGYFGVINERFRMDLVQGLLEAGWRVALIGPRNHSAPPMPESAALRWLGTKPYGQLPQYLRQFDLTLIPYDTQGAHRFLYPVKALEYLAGGKPVLSTPLPDIVRFLGDFVLLGESPAQWVAQAERLRDDSETVRTATLKGREYAFSRSWDQMVEEMLATLEERAGK